MTTREFWDRHAAAFDDEPDHGLRDPRVRDAWARLLLPLIPSASSVVDLGCGTGSLSVLLAGAGHEVHGLDLSEEMVKAARAKAAAAGVAAEFSVGDAVHPPHPKASFGVVLARHVLWALPDPASALEEWVSLLAPGGVLLLVEGRWSTGAGLTSSQTRSLVLGVRAEAVVTPLTSDDLWGRPIEDERYLVVSRR
ncbi:class I SAM-dependent methyltransferase [Lentzea sp. NPDC051208]|uniref:class I SAM-dependent methyltransferase n=1 Tax=Lentzea sp. NPDC051208 TaxID=3154642 RepID=UPI00343132FC